MTLSGSFDIFFEVSFYFFVDSILIILSFYRVSSTKLKRIIIGLFALLSVNQMTCYFILPPYVDPPLVLRFTKKILSLYKK